jgi:Fe-S cluster assembly protein SufD
MKASSQIITNPEGRLRIALEAGAFAEYLVLQDTADREVEMAYDISLAEGASLRMVFLSLDGKLLRNRVNVSLEGRHASCDLSGLYLPRETQEMAFDIRMDHLVPECHSTQLFKSIVDEQAVARFFGLIKVVPDAQKTEAYQANHNLLLSEAARAYTKPQLEIYADDVKCSHGATVGRLNEDELFYMRSRGISLPEARLLQQMAFTGEVLEKIASPEWREKMLARVEERLRSAR